MKNSPKRDLGDVFSAGALNIDATQPGWEAAYLAALDTSYQEFANPTIVWMAIEFVERRQLEYPAFVRRYLTNSSEAITRIVNQAAMSNEAEAIGRALGFGADGKGQAPAGRLSSNNRRDLRLAALVVIEMYDDTAPGPSKAAGIVANREKLSKSTVERAYERYGTTAMLGINAHLKRKRQEKGIS